MEQTLSGLQLSRAIFLRGVSDPVEGTRITTVFYRPKHMDLRYEDGFVRAGAVNVPVSNVVEMTTLLGNPTETRHFAEEPAETPIEEPVHEEADKPVRRRGRPRKNPVG